MKSEELQNFGLNEAITLNLLTQFDSNFKESMSNVLAFINKNLAMKFFNERFLAENFEKVERQNVSSIFGINYSQTFHIFCEMFLSFLEMFVGAGKREPQECWESSMEYFSWASFMKGTYPSVCIKA